MYGRICHQQGISLASETAAPQLLLGWLLCHAVCRPCSLELGRKESEKEKLGEICTVRVNMTGDLDLH